MKSLLRQNDVPGRPVMEQFGSAEMAREQGLIVNAARPDVLRFMPALNVSLDEIAICIGTLDKIFAELFPRA